MIHFIIILHKMVNREDLDTLSSFICYEVTISPVPDPWCHYNQRSHDLLACAGH